MASDYVIDQCIEWNEASRRRAQADADNPNIKVPKGAARKDFYGKEVVLTVDEYRAERAKDARRFAQNIMSLRQRRTEP